MALLPAGGETPDYICVDDQLPVDIHWPSKQEEFLFGSPDPAPAESGNLDDLGELDELDEDLRSMLTDSGVLLAGVRRLLEHEGYRHE